MTSHTRLIYLLTIILLVIQACSSPTAPEEETQDGLFTLKVTKGGSVAPDAEVFVLTAENTLKDRLRTNASGMLTYDPEDSILPEKLLIRTDGFTIGALEITSPPNEILSIDLEPAQERSIQLIIGNSYAESVFTVGVVVDGFMIDTLYSQTSQMTLSYGLPAENSEIKLLNPDLPLSSQSSKYQLMIDDLQDYRKIKLTSLLTETSIPKGTRLYNGTPNGFEVMSDGWVWYKINSAQGNEDNQEFEVYGDDFDRIEFSSSALHRFQNYFFRIFPLFDAQTTYSELFEINSETLWKFNVEKSSFFSGSARSSDYVLTWDFEDILNEGNQRHYIITETAIGNSTGPGGGVINSTTSIKITENEFGMWFYSTLDDRSQYSIPLSNFEQNFIEQPSISPEKSILVKRKNGSEYRTLFSQIGRIVPNDVSAYESTFDSNKFEINDTGITRIETRTGGGHNYESTTAIRIP